MLKTTQAAGPQPTSYRSLALSPLQQLLDFFLPAPHATLQLPVLCHVGVHQAQESTGILLQPGCLPLKHRCDDCLGVPASPWEPQQAVMDACLLLLELWQAMGAKVWEDTYPMAP